MNAYATNEQIIYNGNKITTLNKHITVQMTYTYMFITKVSIKI